MFLFWLLCMGRVDVAHLWGGFSNMLFWIKLHNPFSAVSWSVVVSWSTEKDNKQRKRRLLLCKNRSFAEGMFTGGTFVGRMVKPFKAFKRQQHSAATGLLVYIYEKQNQLLCNRWSGSTKGLSQFHLSAKFQAALMMVSGRKKLAIH